MSYTLVPYFSIYSPLSSASPLNFFNLSGGKECLCSFLYHFKRSGGEDFVLLLLSICFLSFYYLILMMLQVSFFLVGIKKPDIFFT